MEMKNWSAKAKLWWPVLKAAATDWSHDRAPRLGAALAYYTTFSMVPLLIVVIGIIWFSLMKNLGPATPGEYLTKKNK